jgi:hypothetical protein
MKDEMTCLRFSGCARLRSQRNFVVVRSFVLVFAVFFWGEVVASQSGEIATQVMKEMRYGQAFDNAKRQCLDRSGEVNIEALVAETPGLFGGILSGDPFWEEAKALYLNLLKAGCSYDKAAAENAFAEMLSRRLSSSDLQSVLDFYRSEVGQNFAQASIEANAAADRASSPDVNSNDAYKAYERGLDALLIRREKKESEQRRSN